MRDLSLFVREFGPQEEIRCWCGNLLLKSAEGTFLTMRRQTALHASTGTASIKCRKCRSLVELKLTTGAQT